jgi:peptidoglycan/xylan/chitin deacetylase (PgdA/CDA1 family)
VFVNREAAEHNRLDYGVGYERLSRRYDTRVYLDAEEIRSLADQSVLIGNHTRTHPDLSTCSPARLEDEIAGNQTWIERVTGRPVRHLALPFGKRRHYTEDVLGVARACGHAFIYGTDSAFYAGAETVIPRFSVLSQDAAALTYMFNRAGMRRASPA